MEIWGPIISVVLFIGCIVFLEWLSVKHPPYDWKADALKYRAQKEKELEEYKRSLR
jgi:hypothetical protein